MIVRNY